MRWKESGWRVSWLRSRRNWTLWIERVWKVVGEAVRAKEMRFCMCKHDAYVLKKDLY